MIEFPTNAGEPWVVWDDLGVKDAFGVETAAELAQFQETMVGQGRVWDVVRLRFGVGPLIDSETRERSLDETAKSLGLGPRAVEEELVRAAKFFRKAKGLADYRKAAPPAPALGAPKPEPLNLFTVEEAEVDEVLRAAGFHHVDPELRPQVATRVRELSHQLRQPHLREQAKAVIDMEINRHATRRMAMHFTRELSTALEESEQVDRLLRELNRQLADLRGATDAHVRATLSEHRKNLRAESRELSDRVAGLRKDIAANDDASAKLAERHAKMLAEIGADEKSAQEQKKLALDQLSHVVEATKRFRQKKDSTLLDGVFTAGELDFLLTPTDVRNFPQYRADIVVRLQDALAPENLFDPEWRPTPVVRAAVHDLRKIVAGLREVREARRFPEIDREVTGTGEEADEIADSLAGTVSAPIALAAQNSPASNVAELAPWRGAELDAGFGISS